jgi:hypothetical protein
MEGYRVKRTRQRQRAKAPIRLTGVLFALAANLLLTTGADIVVRRLQVSLDYEIIATLVAPFIAGLLSALYARQRGAMHAFIGGMLSVPILAIYVFALNWQLAVFAGAFCGLGGAMTEILLRRRIPAK